MLRVCLVYVALIWGDDMAVSDAQKRANAKHDKENFEYCTVKVRKGSKQVIREAATNNGDSLNGYIKKAIAEKIKSDMGYEADI